LSPPQHHLEPMDPNAFYGLMVKEVTQNLLRLDERQAEAVAGYYRKSLIQHPERLKFYQYNWAKRVEPMVNLLRSLPKRDRPWRVLDAGCGVGTESIFFGSSRSDLEITGVDIADRRLAAAEARKTAYAAYLDRALSIYFTNQDVFQLLRSHCYDLIWSMESISHIDPAETFIENAFRSLEDRGSLVISDSHQLNPVVITRALKHQRRGGHRDTRRVAGGNSISYARERVFSVPHLASLLRAAGFHQIRSQLSIYFPGQLSRFTGLLRHWDSLWNRIPLLRYVGGIYTITASKL
jgi:2-polyprenyl-3-methyl-5-hydroxy-6-metoxy-1,4-benzoquinol methylase